MASSFEADLPVGLRAVTFGDSRCFSGVGMHKHSAAAGMPSRAP